MQSPYRLTRLANGTRIASVEMPYMRSVKRITEAVEGLGGYLNAFTTEDHTCYYAKAAAPHLPDLCDVLCDMYLESVFAPAEIERDHHRHRGRAGLSRARRRAARTGALAAAARPHAAFPARAARGRPRAAQSF